ncbi:MAG: hypothetical protein AMS18_07115 [Gemmatimonas sp. SG8_17]|nr:MAG: hypothetical protein AMS18_07115 [Gemmatimonas sp. SG8_17]
MTMDGSMVTYQAEERWVIRHRGSVVGIAPDRQQAERIALTFVDNTDAELFREAWEFCKQFSPDITLGELVKKASAHGISPLTIEELARIGMPWEEETT